jgi:CRP-like cAMP-binding protein
MRLSQVLNDMAIPATVPSGARVFRCGDKVSAVFVVRKGRIAMVWCAASGVHPMDTAGPGAIIGMDAALSGEYSVTARAVEDCELGYVPVDRFMQLIKVNPDLCFAAMRFLGLEEHRMRAMVVTGPAGATAFLRKRAEERRSGQS